MDDLSNDMQIRARTPSIQNGLWITWERQRRNISFAKAIGVNYCEIIERGSHLRRYIKSVVRTLQEIKAAKPSHIFYQNPSLFLAVTVTCFGRLLSPGTTIIGDYHNAGVFPPIFPWLARFAARRSDLVIVTNGVLAQEIESWGAPAVSIPDPLPTLTAVKRSRTQNGFLVLFVCSWADDEPVSEVVKAAEILSGFNSSIEIHITGRPKQDKLSNFPRLPNNVTLTGFLSHEEFDQYLFDANVVMDLTTRPDCMVCGGYEAVAAETPAILSDNTPTKKFFSKGALFVDNSADSIASAINTASDNEYQLRVDVASLKTEIRKQELDALSKLLSRIQ